MSKIDRLLREIKKAWEMSRDERIHDIFDALRKNEIPFHSFSDVGLEAPYFSYYYAEDELYLIRDEMVQNYWFIRADSPKAAYEVVNHILENASSAGAYVDEEVK